MPMTSSTSGTLSSKFPTFNWQERCQSKYHGSDSLISQDLIVSDLMATAWTEFARWHLWYWVVFPFHRFGTPTTPDFPLDWEPSLPGFENRFHLISAPDGKVSNLVFSIWSLCLEDNISAHVMKTVSNQVFQHLWSSLSYGLKCRYPGQDGPLGCSYRNLAHLKTGEECELSKVSRELFGTCSKTRNSNLYNKYIHFIPFIRLPEGHKSNISGLVCLMEINQVTYW